MISEITCAWYPSPRYGRSIHERSKEVFQEWKDRDIILTDRSRLSTSASRPLNLLLDDSFWAKLGKVL